MRWISCTAKLQKEMGLQQLKAPPQVAKPLPGLGNWHANLIRIERRKCVLFANDRTLFNFLVVGLKRAEIRELDALFREHLHKTLLELDFGEQKTSQVLGEYKTVEYAKTCDRSVLGSMNDLANNYICQIRMASGLERADMTQIIQRLNEMPMGALGYEQPRTALRQVLKQSG